MRICFSKRLASLFCLLSASIPQPALADRTAGTNAVVSSITHTSASFSASITTDANGTGEYTLFFYVKEVGATAEFFPTAMPGKIAVGGNATTTFTGAATSLACGRNYQVTGAFQLGSTARFAGPGYTTFSTLPCASISPDSITLKHFLGTAIAPIAFTTANFNGTPTFQVTPSLPPGLSFNGSTGAIAGTPTVVQTETRYTIRGTGSVSGTATATVSLTVAPLLTDLEVLRYVASQPDLIDIFGTDVAKARQHYLDWGFNEGRKITFEPLYYTASHPDLIEAFGLDETKSVTHYIRWGYKERRQTTFTELTSLRYIASHPDLIEALGADAGKGVRHYIQWGHKEGRPITFDPLRYTASHFDLIDAFGVDERKATTHYIQWGYKEKRQVTFRPIDALNYIASSFDLIAAFGADVAAGTRHYVQWGFKEGRKIVFDALAYIASHFDLISAFGADAVAGATHYINTGFKEGRRVTFDALGYLAAHFDLRAAFGADTTAATQHYINWGFKEGRSFLWTVSATAGPGGRVSSGRLYAKTNETVSLTLTPDSGYTIDSVTGCGGSLSGTIYTTSAISGTCLITASFRLITADISITARYQRPGPAPTSGAAPNWESPVTAPIPNVWIELRNSKGELVSGGYADQNGRRLFTGMPTNETYSPVIRARALTNAGFDLWVVNNTIPIATNLSTPRARYQPYSLQFSAFSPVKTSTSQAYTVTAATGWNTATKSLDDGMRHSAPFSIISDVIRQQLAVSSVGATNNRNRLTIFWSTANKGGGEGQVYNYDLGIVPGSGAFFSSCAPKIGANGVGGECSTENIPIVFLRGSRGYWNDDFDTGTIIHELTHFTQSESMRGSSPGGRHDFSTYQDFRLAHEEGFATAAATIVARSPRLESYYNGGTGSVTSSISDYSKAQTKSPVGWFQERTFIRFIWALFDPAGDFRLSESEIYAPYYSAEWRSGSFVPSMWAYGKILKDQQPSKGLAIDQLGTTLNITLRGNDVWGTAETVWQDPSTPDQVSNSRQRTQKQVLPVVTTVPLSGSVEVCSAGKPYEYNYLSNRRYLRFIGDGKPKKITVTGPESTVPFLWITGVGGFFEKGSRSVTRTAIVPATGAWGEISECKVIISDGYESCSTSDYNPPEEQCWTVKVE